MGLADVPPFGDLDYLGRALDECDRALARGEMGTADRLLGRVIEALDVELTKREAARVPRPAAVSLDTLLLDAAIARARERETVEVRRDR